MATVYIKRNAHFAEVVGFYKKVNNSWEVVSQQNFLDYIDGNISVFGGNIPAVYTFRIAAPSTDSAETCQCLAVLNDTQISNNVVWSVVSGGTYATIDNTGLITFSTAASNSNITIQAVYSSFTATHDMVITYKAGSSSETTTETTTDESGNTITTTTVVTENEDGTSVTNETSVVTDESGNTIQTTESETNTNADGSYDSTSTTYDENGDPTETINASGDTDGNVSTQGIEYENGEPVVTGYTVDTSGNPDGEKTYNGDGVNTEYYAFDLTHGFTLHLHFTIDFTAQPAGQDENHHNVLTMKRASPQPWYGFQLRQSSTNKYVQLGTQFSGGSNTNTTINPSWITTNVLGEYDLTITYTPSASTNAFVCYNNLTSSNVYRSNNKFPDIDDLKYLKVTIGYAMDPNGNPYRYSNINVLDFSITRT